MLLSPMLNKMLKDAIIKTKVMYIILLAVINIWFGFVCGYQIVLTGYNFINFVLLYLIGDLLHSVNLKKYKARTYLYSYLGLSILLAIFSVVIYYAGYTNLLLKCFYYNNPIVLLSSAALFCCFANIKISSKSVNYIAASVLPIYLVQEGGINFYKLVSTYEQGPIMTFIFFGIIFIIISFVIPIAFDKIRIFLFSKMENKLISKLELTTQKIKFFNGEADNS
jgi:hypothetical protein